MRRAKFFSWMLAAVCLVGISVPVLAGVPDGLISYWDFDEGEGAIAGDAAGSNDGTIYGDAPYAPGRLGTALSLDGAGAQYVDCGDDDSLKPAAVTVSAWIKIDSYSYYGQIAGFAHDSGSEESGYSIMVDDWYVGGSQPSIAMWLSGEDEDGSYFANTDEPEAPTDWVHVVCTYDGENSIVYIDGVGSAPDPLESGPISYTYATTFKIGVYAANDWWLPYAGLVDEIGVWDRAISPEEVAYLYNGGAGQKMFIIKATPGNGADLVLPDQVLSWEEPEHFSAEAYDVYFGTDPNTGSNPLVSAAQVELSYDPDLDYDTTYYWRVDLLEPNTVGGGFMVTEGAWLTFTTAPALPVITDDPDHGNVDAGGTAVLVVGEVNGEDYQWFKEEKGEGVPLTEGAKYVDVQTASLSIVDFQMADEGLYYCEVSNGAGAVLSASAVVRTKRMMHHWPLDGNVDDIIGGINGTIVGDPNFVAGKDGQAISLLPAEGELDSVVLGLVGDIVGDLDFSISVWVNTTGTPTYGSMLSSKDWGSGGNTGIGLFDYSGTVHWNIADETGWRNDLATPTFYDGEWHNVCVTVDREGQQTMYVDGETTDSADIQGMVNTIEGGSPLAIGIDAVGNYPFQGKIDDLRVYNYVLNRVEAALLYTDMNPGKYACIEPLGIWDVNADCIINLGDLAEIAARWLDCNRVPECITE